MAEAASTPGEDIISALTDNTLTTLALQYTFSTELVKRIATALESNNSVTSITIGSWHAAGVKKKMPEGFAAIVAAAENNYNTTACKAVGLPPHGKFKEPAVQRQVGQFVKQMCAVVERNLERCYVVTLAVLERKSDGLRISCKSLAGDEVAVLEVGCRDVASSLYQRLHDTQAELLDGRRLVLLVPDGSILEATDMRPVAQALTTKEEVLEVFRRFDADADGAISSDELREVLRRRGTELVDETELQQLFSAMDVDKDGSVPISDFLDFMLSSGDGKDVETLMNAAASP